ncbi:MAG: hypothetical protein M3440_00665 [Chloroflexota bacterium]|nr:hypothetical protein [Chloroflexota bacterium]
MISTSNATNTDARSFRVVEMTDRLPAPRGTDIANLESRLADGYQRIESAISRGEDVRVWEDFWISLLHSYEELCDDMEQAA